jgi:hypothetical protein
VTALGQSGGDVGGDLAGAVVVGGQVPVDRGHPARRLRAGVAAVAVGSLVHVEDRNRPGRAAGRHDAGQGQFGPAQVGAAGRGDGVPYLAGLQVDEVIELVAPVWGGGQAQPAAGGDLADGVGECRSRDVVAFVGDDEAVPGGQLADVRPPGEGLQCGDVDGATQLCPAAAQLPRLDVEELADAGAPLVGQGLAIDQDQRRCAVRGDQRAGDDSLARTWGRDQNRELVAGQLVDGLALDAGQRPGKGELLPVARGPLVGDLQPTASFLREGLDLGGQASGRIRPPSIVSSKQDRNRGTLQVEARMRCRSSNTGLRIDAACRSAVARPGVSSACSTRMPARRRAWTTGAGTGRVADDTAAASRVTSEPTATRPAWLAGGAVGFARAHPAQRRQVGKLVGVGFQRPLIEEHGAALVAGGLEQRRGDEVADTAGGEQVLGREQPVVAGQLHPAAQRHRLPQQPGTQPPRGRRQYRAASNVELLIFDGGELSVALPSQAVVVALPGGLRVIPVTGPLLAVLSAGEPDDDDRVRPGWILKRRVCQLGRDLSSGRQVLHAAGETFGGPGCQEAVGWLDGRPAYGPSGTCDSEVDREEGYDVVPRSNSAINVGLRLMGVMAAGGLDEYEAAGLASHRSTDDWLGS